MCDPNVSETMRFCNMVERDKPEGIKRTKPVCSNNFSLVNTLDSALNGTHS